MKFIQGRNSYKARFVQERFKQYDTQQALQLQ